MVDRQDTVTTADMDFGDMDYEYLNSYLASVCYPLINVNKDFFYKELHSAHNQKVLKQFSTEKNSRALLIAKVEKRTDTQGEIEEKKQSEQQQQEQIKQSTNEDKEQIEEDDMISQSINDDDFKDGKNMEIKFALKVVYYGQVAHTIAFLKREAYSILDIKYGETPKHLSQQLQVLNLGFIGEDSNIFELAATYVEYSLLPLFNSYRSSSSSSSQLNDEKQQKLSTSGLENVQKNLMQLKVHLVQCQQNLDIPEIELIIDSDVKIQCDKCKELGKEPTVEDFEGKINDEFLRRLQKSVNQWYRDIRKVTTLDHDPSSGSALQEINFWLSLERSLTHIKDQLNKKEVKVTLSLLQQAKRIQTVFTFLHDTGLEPSLKQATSYNQLLRDFPINSLLSANTLEQIQNAIIEIFKQLKNLRHSDHYPLKRAMLLLEAISRDLNNQLFKLFSNFQIMNIEYKEFKTLQKSIKSVFETWFESLRQFKEMIRQQGINRADRGTVQNVLNLEKNALKDRLDNIITFRYHHYKLKQVVSKTLSKENIGIKSSESSTKNFEEQALNDINQAYSLFLNINVLDISKEGQESWDSTKKFYDQMIDKVESQITSTLRDKLASASNANEMFKVFSIFNALFTRPRIRGAIQEYQNQLLAQVKKDIQALKEKLINEDKMDAIKFQVNDFPQISNKITWIKQIERKLQVYLDRVQKVLGEAWEQHQEGRDLKLLGDQFQEKLTKIQQFYFDQWNNEISQINIQNEKEKSLFEIEQRVDNKFELVLNFNQKLFNLFKELINLKRLGFRAGLSVSLKSQEVQGLYPIAMSLQESLRTFQYTNSKITDKFVKLIAQVKAEAQGYLIEGLNFNWKTESRVDTYAKKLSVKIMAFEEAVTEVMEKTQQIEEYLIELGTCEISKEQFNQRLKCIQDIIDEFNFQEYSNLNLWVEELDQRIQQILIGRLEELIQAWVTEFKNYKQNDKNLKHIKVTTVLDIKILNQTIILDPPIQEARTFWYKQFHDNIELICGLQKVEASRYERFKDKDQSKREKTYKQLILQMDQKVLNQSYKSLEEIVTQADQYQKKWKSYQALWDMDPQSIYEQLGENIDKWHQLLNEIRQDRKILDTSDVEQNFGAIIIYYGGIQSKVNNKYDQWHKEILNKFGTTLNDNMKNFNNSVLNSRRKLETLSIDASDDVTLFVTEIQEMKRQFGLWNQEIDRYKSGQKLLITHRYQFPQQWLKIELVDSEWNAFKQILQKKSKAMDDQIPTLQAKILEEEKTAIERIKLVEEEWKSGRPSSGSLLPSNAMNLLTVIGTKIINLKNEWIRICKAKELLDMELGNPRKLDDLEEDLQGLKEVWQEINKVWSIIDTTNEIPFSAYVHKTVKTNIDSALEQMKQFSNKLRQYQVYDEYKEQIQKYRKVNIVFSELKSEAMKPRHWKNLLVQLKIRVNFNELILNNFWQADLLRNDKIVKDILSQARGEQILEDFLRNIKDVWSKFELELIKYQNKCKLIKGWDELFQQIDEHISNLSSMKMSPYYKVFEEEIVPWDDKLQKIRIIFDTWIDVQRRYVYLEGIFFGSADIKTMLAAEFSRFKGIDAEFVKLMKQVQAKPVVLDIVSGIQGLQKTLERFSDMLSKIQKALGDYLEKQRQNFARFYFVGDEDLLEIIGNSKEIRMVQRHFPKMFAGITSMKFENDGDMLVGMFSREGEYVQFYKNVIISEDQTIYVWLTKIESQMQMSLAHSLEEGMQNLELINRTEQQDEFNEWIQKYSAQIVLLSMQVSWSQKVEDALMKHQTILLMGIEEQIKQTLEMLAEKVLSDLKKDIRQKYEQLITDLVHQREVTRQLINDKVTQVDEFEWLYHMRFYFKPKEQQVLNKLQIQMANGNFLYGFEYLGVGEKLVQTPLTDRCYLTLTQALHWRLGGSPFGPAGTGKTESVKALGSQLGRFVLVFNCDETFDGNAMGRIFVGLCQVGAWGCFDEFNRLEERMLSAVSQQILIIQMGLREQAPQIELMSREIKLNSSMGIFITMNPGYAGRSNLPDNLKQLFRQMAMVKPDKEMIARVMLYSQGFKTAEKLSGKIVSLFDLCGNQLSQQSHYDFGLRALKSVLVSAGNLKRSEKLKNPQVEITAGWEESILIKSLCDTVVPKLISEDIPLLQSLLQGTFPGSSIIQIRDEKLINAIQHIAVNKYNLVAKDLFIEKVLQLFQIQNLHHGVMMVGPTGVGKSQSWKVLQEAMEKIDGIKGESYIIDPKAINKDALYGKLDSTTAEWTDGVFTGILRRIIDNVRGESARRHWLIFDGDVDPEWAENLNSVLDDNKLLTLPSGERLALPGNVRIMFEVENLKNATLATVSRCGMVWFSQETISVGMVFQHYLLRLAQDDYDSLGSGAASEDSKENQQQQIGGGAGGSSGGETKEQQLLQQLSPEQLRNRDIRKQAVQSIKGMFDEDSGFVQRCLDCAQTLTHVMEFTRIRCLESMFALIRKGISNIIDYNDSHSDFPLSQPQTQQYMQKWVVFSILWGIGGSMSLSTRTAFSKHMLEFSSLNMPPVNSNTNGPSLLDYEIRIEDQEWHLWKKKVPQIDIDPSKVTEADLVITTVDTLRHQEVLCSWINEHRPFLLCGPPGSGKTMTLMSTLKNLPDFEMIFINFSSSTMPELILKTFDHYCEYKKTPNGIILHPNTPNKHLVVFCDEINLPETDKYGTQVVITFLRQITEQHGFWRAHDKQWIKLDRIQFVGACNPPTDSGRSILSDRFLRHCPLIFVDFPGAESLKQIYGTFNKAMLKKVPVLKQHSENLTEAMVQFYTISQQHFTSDIQPHYIYSPRELTRWKYAINEALSGVDCVEDLARLYLHEGLRLFEDRLVQKEEKEWCNKELDSIIRKIWGSNINMQTVLERPILFTNYLKKDYISVKQEELKSFIQARLQTFYEEELNVPLVVFDSVLDHILRIDRVLRQPLGHLLLVGASGVGKTTLSRFVSWMNNLSVFQIKAGRNYSVYDFDDDLRNVMKRAGCKQEKICFIFDESNILSAAFLERMNALLASGEVPGLFDGEEYILLINNCKESAQKEGKIIDTEEELYKHFTVNVQRNLHVVFTMNPASGEFSNRTASSPALFNRCVIDWFGDWSQEGLLQVAKEFTKNLDIVEESFTVQYEVQQVKNEEGKIQIIDPKHEILSQLIVDIHTSVRELNQKMMKQAKKSNYITPRDFLDFIHHFITLQQEKKEELQEQQYHLNVGLEKLKQTEEQVLELQGKLNIFSKELNIKDTEANQKLKQMLIKQQEAETKKELSIKTSQKLEKQSEVVRVRQEEVKRDLSKAEPALIAAQDSVSGITKAHLDDLRSLLKPPANVVLAMEPVIILINNQSKPAKSEWNEIRQQLRKDTFIQSVLNFDKDLIKPAVKRFIQVNYLEKKEEFVIEKIFKASKAAGPLALWVSSIVEYADIFERIQPMRDTLIKLETEEEQMRKELDQFNALISELEANIEQYKVEYGYLIGEVNNIKTEMTKVQDKVKRSQQLIQNLSSERIRWEESSLNFKEQLACLLGDVLLSSAFLTYIGFFDHYYRQYLQTEWKIFLEQMSLKYRADISLIEFLSTPSDRLLWQSQELPNDSLCIENAIVMKRFNRYPLIVDPSDQAFKFIVNHYADKKIQKTSFADEGFMKNLETAIRFGLPLLVQDVEKIEPILNSVLNKEVHKQGGRILIRVGDQEIDFSSSFLLFMITRNNNAYFTPDLCSRVTFVNFTVTPSSLQNQCLNIYLKNEREEIDKKRNDLLKLQGECKVKLRELEDALLEALNKSEGNILDNNELIGTLETLKKEAQQISKEVEKTEETMKEIEEVSNLYLPLATMTSRIFFTLQSLSEISFLYQYSLSHFMDYIYYVLLQNEEVQKYPKNQPDLRLKIITKEMFVYVYGKVGEGLMQEHQVMVALRMMQIRMQGESNWEEVFEMLIKSSTLFKSQIPTDFLGSSLSKSQLIQLEELEQSEKYFPQIMEHLSRHQQTFIQYITGHSDVDLPQLPPSNEILETQQIQKLKQLQIVKILRGDKFQEYARSVIEGVLGDTIFSMSAELDLKKIIDKESQAKSPILLVSAPGYDASYKVDILSKSYAGKKYTQVALGSPEAFDLADKAIKAASKSGHWVLLKNVHLTPTWLIELEKSIYKLQFHPQFRLFLTMEFNPKVPSTLLRASHIFIIEPPQGIKASMLRSFSSLLSAQKSDLQPIERSRLHFLVAWFNAIVQERLRYIPIGWSKAYEFNESDQRCLLDCVDEWVNQVAGNKMNVNPDKIPWDALRVLIRESIFGGKIDNEYDQRILGGLVEQIFRKEAFDSSFLLVQGDANNQNMYIPDVRQYKDFLQWVKDLPSVESPQWSGLPSNVEKLIKERQTVQILSQLKILQGIGDDHEEQQQQEEKKEEAKHQIKGTGKGKQTGKEAANPNQQQEDKAVWLVNLQKKIEKLMSNLPLKLDLLNRTQASITNPLFRFLERELTVACSLLKTIKQDLAQLKEMCMGERKNTNILKLLATDLHSEKIPLRWKKYNISTQISASEFITDFSKRVDQLQSISKMGDFGQKEGVWLGGLLFPEAYMTATRQRIAQDNKWSLDELELEFSFLEADNRQGLGNDAFVISGLSIEGGEYQKEGRRIVLSESLQSMLPLVVLKWIRKEKGGAEGGEDDEMIQIPMYLNKQRNILLFSIKINKGGLQKYIWYQRGVALFAWNKD